jgi:hypothetical protein
MSERRKAVEAMRASTPSTPTKQNIPSQTPVPIPGVSTPTKQKIRSLTPVPIPGMSTPRRVKPGRPWTLQAPSIIATHPNGTPIAPQPPKSTFKTLNNSNVARPSGTPLKSILKTPEREKRSGGKTTHSGGLSSSQKKRNHQKKLKIKRESNVSFTPDTRGHGSS